MTESKARIEWIDQAKGWGMILVVFGHGIYLEIPHKLVYSFHIPFFFALSGWLYNPTRYTRFRELAKARWKSIVIPYILYSVIGYLGLVGAWCFGRKPRGLSPIDPVISSLLAVRTFTPYNGTLWFIACLLLTEFCFYWLYRLTRRIVFVTFVISFIPLILIIRFPNLLPFPFPWSLDIAFVATMFYAFGQLLRSNWETMGFQKMSWWLIALIILGWFLTAMLDDGVNMYMDQYGKPLIFVLAGLLGTSSGFFVVSRIHAFKMIGFIGRHSLVILALHQWLAFNILRSFQSHLPSRLILTSTWYQLLEAIFYTAGSILILWPICIAFDRWAPILVGGARK